MDFYSNTRTALKTRRRHELRQDTRKVSGPPGGFRNSDGAVGSLSGFALSWGWKTFDPAYGAWIGIGLALAAGALVGYINGVMVARIGVPSIMATLAANFFWYGISILLAGGLQVALKASQDNFVHELFVGRLFGAVPLQAFWSLGLAVLLWFVLNRHKFGEGIMFIGDNANVARVMGVNVETTRIKLFALHGMIAAFSGIIVTLDIRSEEH